MDQTPIEIREIVLHVKFTHGDTVLFQGADWYWFAGGVTRAVKKGLASVQENWRTPDVGEPIPLKVSWPLIVYGGVIPQTWVFRKVFESEPKDFDALVTTLATMKLGAPYYVAVAGTQPGQGVVFARTSPMGQFGMTENEKDTVVWGRERNRSFGFPDGIERLNANPTNGQPPVWYLVQTNSDRWMEDVNPRRHVSRLAFATAALDQAGRKRGATSMGLFGTAQLFPITNPTTVFVAVMNAAKGSFEAFVSVDPMWPIDKIKWMDAGMEDEHVYHELWANESIVRAFKEHRRDTFCDPMGMHINFEWNTSNGRWATMYFERNELWFPRVDALKLYLARAGYYMSDKQYKWLTIPINWTLFWVFWFNTVLILILSTILFCCDGGFSVSVGCGAKPPDMVRLPVPSSRQCSGSRRSRAGCGYGL